MDNSYTIELNDMRFTYDEQTDYYKEFMQLLVKEYPKKKKDLVNFIVNNEEFIELYGKVNEKEMLDRLEIMPVPWIFLHKKNKGTIAYCDENYVIEFAFQGLFEALNDLDIRS